MTMMMYCTSGCVGVGAEERRGERGRGRSYTEVKCQPRGKGVGQRGGGVCVVAYNMFAIYVATTTTTTRGEYC